MPRRRVRKWIHSNLNLLALKDGISYLKQLFKQCGLGNIKIDIINDHFDVNIITANDWAIVAMSKIYIHYPLDRITGYVSDAILNCFEYKYGIHLEGVIFRTFRDIASTQLELPPNR